MFVSRGSAEGVKVNCLKDDFGFWVVFPIDEVTGVLTIELAPVLA